MKTKKRNEYLSWNQFFMGIAKLAAARSKDPSTQVGACIVDKDNRILSIGYNGTPNGFDDDIFPWAREGEETETKYPYVCHAEMNAILNYRGSRKDFKDATVYVDLFPCHECAKLIVQSGITHVVYLSDKYKDTNDNIESRRIFDTCGVFYTKLDEVEQNEYLLSLKPDVELKKAIEKGA